MKLSVCHVVIIANRKVDNAIRGGISDIVFFLSPPLITIVESEGRFALHATSFST